MGIGVDGGGKISGKVWEDIWGRYVSRELTRRVNRYAAFPKPP